MINSKDQYRFIKQDSLDGIIIDGGIMPFRTGYCNGIVDANGNKISKKNILRGEDIAFITECVCEKMCWWKSKILKTSSGYSESNNPRSVSTLEFDKSLSGNQLWWTNPIQQYLIEFFHRLLDTFHFRSDYMEGLTGGLENDFYVSTSLSTDSIIKEILFDTGMILRLSDSDCYNKIDWDWSGINPLNKEFVLSMIYDSLKSKCVIPFSYANPYIASKNVYEYGTGASLQQCWSGFRNDSFTAIGGCDNQLILRIKVNGDNIESVSEANLYAVGNVVWSLLISPYTEIRKTIVFKAATGINNVEDGESYLDFYLTVTKEDVDTLLNRCGMPALTESSEPVGMTSFYFNYSFFPIIRFSDKITTNLI